MSQRRDQPVPQSTFPRRQREWRNGRADSSCPSPICCRCGDLELCRRVADGAAVGRRSCCQTSRRSGRKVGLDCRLRPNWAADADRGQAGGRGLCDRDRTSFRSGGRSRRRLALMLHLIPLPTAGGRHSARGSAQRAPKSMSRSMPLAFSQRFSRRLMWFVRAAR